MIVIRYFKLQNVLNFLLYLGLSMLGFSCTAQDIISLCKQDPTDPTLRYGVLENGFSFYIHKTDTLKNTAEMRLIVKAGSDHEDSTQLEYAHLLEHLAASSTKNFPNVKMAVKSIGAYSHASTWDAFTNYRLNIPNVNSGKVSEGLKILRDWAQNITFEKESVNKQRGAVLGEGRVLDPYQEWLYQRIDSVILKNTGYPFISHKQSDQSIEEVNIHNLRRFYQDWYRPDLQAAIIVGDVKLDSVEKEIKRIFSDLRNPLNSKDANGKIKLAKLPGENQYVSILDTLNPEVRLFVMTKRKNFKNTLNGSKDYKNIAIQEIYESIVRSRSQEYINQSQPEFSNFTLEYQVLNKQMRLSLLMLPLRDSDYEDLKTDFYKALIDYRSMLSGFSVQEFNRAKAEVSKKYGNPSKDNLMELAGKYSDQFVLGLPLYSHDEVDDIMQNLKETSFSDLEKFGNDSFSLSENLDFIFFAPSKNIIPAPNVINSWVNDIKEMAVIPFEVEKPRSVKLDLNKSDSIIMTHNFSRTENLIGITKVVLDNGITIVFKPTRASSERYASTLKIDGFRPIGFDPFNKKNYFINRYAPEIIQFCGAGGYHKNELQKFAEENNLRLRFWSDDIYHKIEASSSTKDLDKVLSLLKLYATSPNKNFDAFEAWKKYKIRQLDDFGPRGSNAFYMDEIRKVWYPDIPKLTNINIRNLKEKNVWKNYKEHFSDFREFTFIVTGEFDTNKILPLFINFLSSDKSISFKEDILYTLDFPMKPINETIRLNNLDQSYIRLFLPVKVPDNEKILLELKLLSEALNENIKHRLREGSYAPRAHGEWLDKENNIFGFVIVFDSEVGNENRLITYALDEFRKIRRDGLDQKWFDTAIRNRRMNFKSELTYFGFFNFWRTYLEERLKMDEGLQDPVLKYGSYLEHFISLDDLNRAATNFMSEDNYQKFIINPKQYKNEITKLNESLGY